MYTSTPVHNHWNVVRLPCISCTLLHLSTITGMLCDCLVSHVHFYTCPQSLECCATALYLMYTSTPVHNHWNVVRLPCILRTLLHLSTITGMLCNCLMSQVHFCSIPVHNHQIAVWPTHFLTHTSAMHLFHNNWNIKLQDWLTSSVYFCYIPVRNHKCESLTSSVHLCYSINLATITGLLQDWLTSSVHFYYTPVRNHWNVVWLTHIFCTPLLQYKPGHNHQTVARVPYLFCIPLPSTCPQSLEHCLDTVAGPVMTVHFAAHKTKRAVTLGQLTFKCQTGQQQIKSFLNLTF